MNIFRSVLLKSLKTYWSIYFDKINIFIVTGHLLYHLLVIKFPVKKVFTQYIQLGTIIEKNNKN